MMHVKMMCKATQSLREKEREGCGGVKIRKGCFPDCAYFYSGIIFSIDVGASYSVSFNIFLKQLLEIPTAKRQ